ncbi:MAG: glutamine--fructose-6-phosphate transaminase (isomerizing) [Rhabdochlamydiaceae bacterium]|nr:glutamine--fructose-6-phosphate transaminase (isomerizing) [Candidatus Amphrikana amoebophyrae]
MCGIFGFIPGSNETASDVVDTCIKGLKQLEYRGYDSAGIAGIYKNEMQSCKSVGKIKSLQSAVEFEKLNLDMAIAHTRWATHGGLTNENAHPHFDEKTKLAVVHNGIIENHFELRKKLAAQDIKFYSETDTEVVAKLVSLYYDGDLKAAVQRAAKDIKGSYALALIHQDQPNLIVATARDCPLVLGLDPQTKSIFISSDTNAFLGRSLDVMFVKNEQLACITKHSIILYDAQGNMMDYKLEALGIDLHAITKNGFEHFMLKEIFEQPMTINRTIEGRFSEEFGTAQLGNLAIPTHVFQSAHHILILGCGTSWHAGHIAASMLESLARIPTQAEIASEFRYTNPIVSENTLVIAISQSGETADTLAAVREVQAKGAKVLGICNVKHSTLSRESDSCIYLKAGPEISVCSTKAFTSQLALLSLLTLHLARIRHMEKAQGQEFIRYLKKVPQLIEEVLNQAPKIEKLAKKYAKFEHFFFLGRQYMFPASLEAALKLKEISYLNATGYPAGEMKHGPIALISPDVAVIAMCGNKKTQDKMISNMMEVKSRGGPIMALAPEGNEEIATITEDVIWMPEDICDELACIPYSVAAQLFSYYIAKERNCEIDQPRNLAKSVTVE